MDINKVKLAFLRGYKSDNQMNLLQGIYLCIAVGFVFLAGLIALLNQPAGVGLLIIPLIAFTAFSVNLVTLSVVKTIAETMLETENRTKRELEASFTLEVKPKKTTKKPAKKTAKKK